MGLNSVQRHFAGLATHCHAEAQRTEQTLAQLLSALAELEASEWAEPEARRFSQEMREDVLPALMRLRAQFIELGEQAQIKTPQVEVEMFMPTQEVSR